MYVKSLSKSRRAAVEKYTVGVDAPQPEEEASTFVSNSGKPVWSRVGFSTVFIPGFSFFGCFTKHSWNAWDSAWDSTFQMGVSSASISHSDAFAMPQFAFNETLPVHSLHQVAKFQPHDLSGLDLNSLFEFDPSVTADLPMGLPSELSFPETEYSLPLPFRQLIQFFSNANCFIVALLPSQSRPAAKNLVPISHLQCYQGGRSNVDGPLARESGTTLEEAQDAQDFDKPELNLDSDGPQRVGDLRDGFWE
ncbi:hypothetical protein B0H11DRAFT_1908768 [Mycena galericulata]|nr:hypothetical protein B0H11DRAFT_1908768 [Mycena galericulata]